MSASDDLKTIMPLVFSYRNYRGEVSKRIVKPVSVRWGSTEWHPEPQWLLLAFDFEKQADREFAMNDISAADSGSDVGTVTSRKRGCE